MLGVVLCCGLMGLGYPKIFNGYSVPSVTVESFLEERGRANSVLDPEARALLLSFVDETNSTKAKDRIVGPILLLAAMIGLGGMHKVIGVEIDDDAELNEDRVLQE